MPAYLRLFVRCYRKVRFLIHSYGPAVEETSSFQQQSVGDGRKRRECAAFGSDHRGGVPSRCVQRGDERQCRLAPNEGYLEARSGKVSLLETFAMLLLRLLFIAGERGDDSSVLDGIERRSEGSVAKRVDHSIGKIWALLLVRRSGVEGTDCCYAVK